MKDMFFKNRWVQIVFGSLLLVAGILTFVFAIFNSTNLTSAISIIVAVCCFILGIIYIASSFASETKVLFPASLFFGSFCIAGGTLLCVDTSILGAIIVYLVGALMLAYGIVCCVKAITFISMKAKVWYIILFFLIAAILITLGILTFVFRSQASQVIYIGTGLAIAVYGVVEIVLGAKKLHKAQNGNKEDEPKEIENKLSKKEVVTKKDDPEVIDKTNE